MEIKVYTSEQKSAWDDHVKISKNGTFMHLRDFMEYHADRFTDYSFLFYKKDKLTAILPGNTNGDIFYSHQGLTYGGLIMNETSYATDVLEMFDLLISTLQAKGVTKIIYKAIPHIYHRHPAEEDLYALFRNNAILAERNISSTIRIEDPIKYTTLRKRGIKNARQASLRVNESDDIELFWKILSNNLNNKYNTAPVHSISEIRHLISLFPHNIKFFSVTDVNNDLLAGTLLFITERVAHIQYIAATEKGKLNNATDILIDHIIATFAEKSYFDYGISTEQKGDYLNKNLIHQKEGFGARGIVYDTYSIDI